MDTYQTQPQQNQFQQAAPFQDPRSTSPAFMYQQQLSNEKENFFERFGSYEQKKNKLRNDLSQEYNQYLNQVDRLIQFFSQLISNPVYSHCY